MTDEQDVGVTHADITISLKFHERSTPGPEVPAEEVANSVGAEVIAEMGWVKDHSRIPSIRQSEISVEVDNIRFVPIDDT